MTELVIAAAKSYLDALISHDASQIRLAPDARRTIHGVVTDGADAIRESLTPPTADQYNIGIRDLRWFVDTTTQDAIAFYLLDVGNTIPPSTAVMTVHLAERFRVESGLITEIEGIFSVSGTANEVSGWS